MKTSAKPPARKSEIGPKQQVLSPLDEARIATIRASLAKTGGFILDDQWYRIYGGYGLSRAAVDRAIRILVERGEATLDATRGGVLVRPVEREQ